MSRHRLHVLAGLLLFLLFCPRTGAAQSLSPACSAQTLAEWCTVQVPSATPMPPGNPNGFIVRSYQGRSRCLDYTPEALGSPIFVNDCDVAHPIVVEEINAQHDVLLHAGSKVIGTPAARPVFTMGNGSAAPALAANEIALVLQNPPSTATVHVPIPGRNPPYFALDGDSIIFAADPTLVAKVENARGAIGTPVVLGARTLADNEFWNFEATDGSGRDPTTGFLRVGFEGDAYCSNPQTCVCRLFKSVPPYDPMNPDAGRGTVIRLGKSVDLSGCPALAVGQGVTIRGDRRGTSLGPEIRSCYMVGALVGSQELCDSAETQAAPIEPMIIAVEGASDVRLTGLRLRGPSRSTDNPQTEAIGVISFEANLRNIFDHNDVSDWPYIGIMTKAHDDLDITTNSSCDPLASSDPQTRRTSAFVARNFIHHNREEEAGYGTETDYGAYPFVFGNTFVSNRHAIAAGKGTAHTAYRAWYNLVLSDAPLQHDLFHTHDFDMHGLGDNGFGGIGGDYIDIFRNTFLGTNRHNFELRGNICNYAEYHNNISLESQGDAVSWQTCANVCVSSSKGPASLLRISKNPDQFNHYNPTSDTLGVGDFDGDGMEDLFLATGTAWYYSPGGKTEWRFLSAKTEPIEQLLFGDFDRDGRTDVVGVRNGRLYVSWGGVSDWELLNGHVSFTGGSDADIRAALAVGDFVGDQRSDIFFADGQQWWLSDAGSGPFVRAATSSFQVKDLRFGDFDGDGKTDVFGVVAGTWSYSKSAQGSWADGYLRPALTNSVYDLVVADFNGDGFADVATDCTDSECWRISYYGFEDWQYFPQPEALLYAAGVGRFLGFTAADVLTWNFFGRCDSTHGQDTQLCISIAGYQYATHYSTQDMK